jgi:phosphoesterase RecJ-like protein
MIQDRLENKFRQAYQKILTAQNILIATHFNSDGDGLSAVCAMIDLAESLGKKYLAFTANEPPAVFAFLPHLEKIRHYTEKPILNDGQTMDLEYFHRFDLMLILDCGSMNRTTLDELIKQRLPNQYLIEMDHHPKVADYTDLELRDSGAAATVELIYRFMKTNRLLIDKNIANCILTGLITDTANFLYPATSELTINIASEMLQLGARLPRIMDNVLKNKSLTAMRLWGRVMSSLKINRRYNIAIAALTHDEVNGDADKEEMDGISGFLSNLYGVKAVLFLREETPGLIRGNLRTAHTDVDVSKIAELFGGGGHAKASGFTIEGKLEKTDHGWKIV